MWEIPSFTARKTARWMTSWLIAAFAIGSSFSACKNNAEGSSSVAGGGQSQSNGTTSTISGPSLGGNPSVTAQGGTDSSGGSLSGGAQSVLDPPKGGAASGGAANGGAATGGAAVGGAATGGKAAGGAATGGKAAGGAATGGKAAGGAATGGKTAGGGAPTGGADTSVSSSGGSSHTGKWQVMLLGDSITAGTCYPQLTSKALISAGHSNFQFIGTQTNADACNGAPNVKGEGHGGYLVTYLTDNTHAADQRGTLDELLTWATEKPEIVVMHYGTNDAWSESTPVAKILSGYTNVVTRFRAQNPSVIFVVAQIIPMAPNDSPCSSCDATIKSLNQQIPSWAATNGTSSSPIYVVDVNTGFNVPTDTNDGVHPNLTGAQKMADKMSAGIIALNLGL